MSSRKELRSHQTQAIAMLRHSLRAGNKRPMLQLATGAGKTVIAAAIFRQAREKNPRVRLLFIVDAVSLIDQTVEAFYAEGLHSIGVIQANHQMTDWSKPIQVASVQTLQRRRMPEADIIIVDEAHCQNAWLLERLAELETVAIGMSATPWSKGLGNHYDDLIVPVTMQELIDAGYLSPFRVFAAAHPDLGTVSTSNGDYAVGELSEVMSAGGLIADIVKTWQRKAESRPTFVFAVDRAHAKKIQLRFEQAGVGSAYIDAHTERDERKAIQKRFEAGEVRVVCSVGCLTKGVDWPVGCIVLARPTKSEMLYVQMVGRGLRVNEGMTDCIILDHSDNTLRMGFVTDLHKPKLCTAKKGERANPERKEPLPKECPKCTFLKPAKVPECPACGFKPEKVSKIEEHEGELAEVKRAQKPDKQKFWSELLHIAAHRKRSRGWASHAYKEKMGVWPRGLSDHPLEPSPETMGWVRHKDIRYAKARG